VLDLLAKGSRALGTHYEEERKMDIAGDLLAIDRCLRSPGFRQGDRVLVRKGEVRAGIVIAVRISISGAGYGNEFEIRHEDGQTEWVDGRLLTSLAGNLKELPCVSAINSSTT
jgi:hypothetical protein